MRHIAKKLEEQIRYINIQRLSHQSGTRDRYHDDPIFQYFMQCGKDCELALPILQYVHKKTLALKEYTLSIGHCNALTKACEHFGMININRIYFDNCGIDDGEFS